MRIISVNLNGIRSAANKGFFKWLELQNADLVCLQEVRASDEQLADKIFHPQGYEAYYYSAQKKGYSGVGIYARQKPDRIIKGLGWDIADTEGRYIELCFVDLSVASVYLPSGSSGAERQNIKFAFLDKYMQILKDQIKHPRQYILCGDWNIAHKNIDLKNWRSNQQTSGFLPEERAWLDQLFEKVGFIDAYRHFNPDKEQYTWWTQRSPHARANNVGWRIDYQIISPALADKITFTDVYTAEKFSDHAPLIIDYAL